MNTDENGSAKKVGPDGLTRSQRYYYESLSLLKGNSFLIRGSAKNFSISNETVVDRVNFVN
jgi:hypothetical protein